MRFDRVCVRYKPGVDHSLALDALDLIIRPGEKVGVVGRTGSGKSTLLAALFRLIDCESGSISIGDVDIRQLPLASLRYVQRFKL